MPELPEVETVARQLAQEIRGLVVKRLEIMDPKLGPLPAARLPGRVVQDVSRLGKQVVLTLVASTMHPPAPLYLVVHLRMTGRLIWHPGARLHERKHLRARLELDGGSVLFHDVRRFGTLKLLDSLTAVQPTGVDPVTGVLTPGVLGQLLGQSRQEIKVWLLRQDRLVGLGNIYASEVLFAARVHPQRAACSLTRPEQRRLVAVIRRVLNRAIAHCGTTTGRRVTGIVESLPQGKVAQSLMSTRSQGRSVSMSAASSRPCSSVSRSSSVVAVLAELRASQRQLTLQVTVK